MASAVLVGCRRLLGPRRLLLVGVRSSVVRGLATPAEGVASLSVRELQAHLDALGVDRSDCFDKESLRERLLEKATTAETPPPPPPPPPPPDEDEDDEDDDGEVVEPESAPWMADRTDLFLALPRLPVALPPRLTGRAREVLCFVLAWDFETKAPDSDRLTPEETEARIRSFFPWAVADDDDDDARRAADLCELALFAVVHQLEGVRVVPTKEAAKLANFDDHHVTYESAVPRAWTLDHARLGEMPADVKARTQAAVDDLRARLGEAL